MADDSIEIIEPVDIQPCSTPRGMLYYDLNILTADQQAQLNDFKRNIIRENEKYLATHPEVRASVALITRRVLLCRPRSDLYEFVGRYFSRPKPDILEDIEEYLEAREPHVCEGDSAVIIREESSEETSAPVSYVEEEEHLAGVPRQVLDNILETAYVRLGIDVHDTGDRVPPVISDTGRAVESVVDKIISEAFEESGMDEELEQVLSYFEDDASHQEYLESSVLEVDAPPASEATATTTETALEVIQEAPEEEEAEEQTQEVAEETKHEAVEEPQQEAVEEPTQEAVEEPKQEAVEEPKQEAVEEPKQEAVEEPKQDDVEQPPQEQVAVAEEAVASPEQPPAEEPQ